jgi:type IV secretory pathway TrbL component
MFSASFSSNKKKQAEMKQDTHMVEINVKTQSVHSDSSQSVLPFYNNSQAKCNYTVWSKIFIVLIFKEYTLFIVLISLEIQTLSSHFFILLISSSWTKKNEYAEEYNLAIWNYFIINVHILKYV